MKYSNEVYFLPFSIEDLQIYKNINSECVAHAFWTPNEMSSNILEGSLCIYSLAGELCLLISKFKLKRLFKETPKSDHQFSYILDQTQSPELNETISSNRKIENSLPLNISNTYFYKEQWELITESNESYIHVIPECWLIFVNPEDGFSVFLCDELKKKYSPIYLVISGKSFAKQ